ncbi:class I SAM-dependent methyltransferase [Bacillus sp. J33]|uniref:class I SAM-dependent methyltransferase n=1 Tax=Bacillus sp. J33 TaxID=935836 RepID=UPI00047B9B9F|nr:class I SAM-dependent methyltransferase [Bacillus sp. J33]
MAGHRFNPEKADRLIDPQREKLISPSQMAKILDIQPQDTIADLGAGNGFFALPFAKLTKEKLIAVDIEPKMLQKLKARAQEAKVHNIEYVESDLETLQLGNETVDKVITAFVLHEVRDLNQVLSHIHTMLKPAGMALLLEWEKVESESGPPIQERILSKDMLEIVKEHPFSAAIHQINEAQYGVLLTKLVEKQ